MARRKATDPANRIGSLVVGRSNPVLCSLALLGQMPSPLFASQADFEARLAFNQRFGDDCRGRTGPVFDHLSSRSVARDLDAIRAALSMESAADEPVVNYAFPATFCQDWSLSVRDFADYQGHLDRMAAVAPDLRFATLSVFGLGWCLGWPAPVDNPQHRLRVGGDAELLLVNGMHDPATSYAWATNVANQIGRRATLLTYEGWGHISYGAVPVWTARSTAT